jgi:hypothetical protein
MTETRTANKVFDTTKLSPQSVRFEKWFYNLVENYRKVHKFKYWSDALHAMWKDNLQEREQLSSKVAAVESRYNSILDYLDVKGFLPKENLPQTSGEQKHEEAPNLRMIITKYPDRCHKCQTKIEQGSIAYWSKDIILCSDCIIQAMGDKTIGDRYLKKRELERVIKALKSQANQYADLILDHKHQIKFNELSKKIDDLLNFNDTFLRQYIGTPQEIEIIRKLNDLYREVKKEWEELKVAVTAKIQPAKFT